VDNYTIFRPSSKKWAFRGEKPGKTAILEDMLPTKTRVPGVRQVSFSKSLNITVAGKKQGMPPKEACPGNTIF
jgi:hypothetical protein